MTISHEIDLAVASAGPVRQVWVGYGDWNQFCAEIGADPEDAVVHYKGLMVSMSDSSPSGVFVVLARI